MVRITSQEVTHADYRIRHAERRSRKIHLRRAARLRDCEKEASVTLIDADPNKPVSQWAKRPGKPRALTVVSNISEDSVIDTIEDAAAQSAFVIVDLEGTASMMVGYAMSRADLVIVPTQGSHLDAAESAKTIKLIHSQERAFGRTIPYAVLFTRTSAAIRSRTLQSIEKQFAEAGTPMFKTQIIEREAYRAIFAFGGTLTGLDPAQVANFLTAMMNAHSFAAEAIAMLKENAKRAKSAQVA
jgi:chromosome partitioning protein